MDHRELFRQLIQDHPDLRAQREPRLQAVRDAGDVSHGAVESGHTRALTTVLGQVQVTRIAYRARGQANLYPDDAALNLPVEKHSHGLRRLAAIEASRGSYDDTAEAIERSCGQHLGKRQVERTSPTRPRPTSTPSTPHAHHHRAPAATCSWSPATARGSSCAPTRCARPPPQRPTRPAPSWRPGCPKEKTAQPQTPHRGRHRLWRHPGRTQPRRHPSHHRAAADRGRTRPGHQQQVADRQRRGRRRIRGQAGLRRGRTARSRPHPHLDSPRRRQQPPDRAHPRRSIGTARAGHHRHRLHPCPGIPLESSLVPPHRKPTRQQKRGSSVRVRPHVPNGVRPHSQRLVLGELSPYSPE